MMQTKPQVVAWGDCLQARLQRQTAQDTYTPQGVWSASLDVYRENKKNRQPKLSVWVVDRGFEPLCRAWEARILALRWIHQMNLPLVWDCKYTTIICNCKFLLQKLFNYRKIFHFVQNDWVQIEPPSDKNYRATTRGCYPKAHPLSVYRFNLQDYFAVLKMKLTFIVSIASATPS